MSSFLRVKCGSGFREIPQILAGSKVLYAGFDEGIHLFDEIGCAESVGVTQRAAAERSEAGAHDHGEINVFRFGDDSFFKAASGFVDHQEDHAGGEGGSWNVQRGAWIVLRSFGVGGWVFAFGVEIEAAAGLAAKETSLDHFAQGFRD